MHRGTFGRLGSSRASSVGARQGGGGRLFAALGHVMFPPLCPLSGEAVSRGGAFAPEAWGRLTFLAPPGCNLCGLPFGHDQVSGPLCSACAAPDRYPRNLCGRGRLDGVRSALGYDRLSAGMVLALKYGDRHDHGPAMGALLRGALGQLAPPRASVLVPVPLHPQRLRARRFNQAAVLAGAVARVSGHEVAPGLLRRKKATPQQKGLGFEARFRNLSGAFAASEAARGRDIVLIDDVLTSGATLIGCARALKKRGAASVRAVTVARALPSGHVPDADLPEAEGVF